MELLSLINFDNLSEDEVKNFEVRHSVRAVIFNEDDRIAFVHASRVGYYKLPGGGIEAGEAKIAAVGRECKEEVGCDIIIGEPIGMITEYRKQFNQVQHSYTYFATCTGEPSEPNYDQYEIDQGFEPLWVTLDEALALLNQSTDIDYMGRHVVARDTIFLQRANQLLKK